jgi:uncharacterized membrane protein YsdA (DUF1294 family)
MFFLEHEISVQSPRNNWFSEQWRICVNILILIRFISCIYSFGSDKKEFHLLLILMHHKASKERFNMISSINILFQYVWLSWRF